MVLPVATLRDQIMPFTKLVEGGGPAGGRSERGQDAQQSATAWLHCQLAEWAELGGPRAAIRLRKAVVRRQGGHSLLRVAAKATELVLRSIVRWWTDYSRNRPGCSRTPHSLRQRARLEGWL
ncbi:hypothetical protein J1614_008625 [Plenodomus biglobosus]|nr:hypothetical protein J1614_008625 [Plenodomus biglobosus]